MGDPPTHVVLHKGYWSLVYQYNQHWINTETSSRVFPVGEEQKKVELP